MATSGTEVQALSASHGASVAGRVAAVTDSVAQVSPQAARELAITVVPMKLVLGDREYRDGIDITPAELYRRMREEKVLPRTSSPSVGDYQRAFARLLRDGATAVVCLTPSSRLTMAFAAASVAARTVQAEFPGRRAEVIDTRMAACAQGFVAVQAARAAAQGASLERVVATAHAVRQRVGLVASVDSLEYLVRGGRVSLAAGLLGGLLQVKPLLTIADDGTATCIGRRRTRRALFRFMIEYVAARTDARPGLQLAVMQADAPQEALQLQ